MAKEKEVKEKESNEFPENLTHPYFYDAPSATTKSASTKQSGGSINLGSGQTNCWDGGKPYKG